MSANVQGSCHRSRCSGAALVGSVVCRNDTTRDASAAALFRPAMTGSNSRSLRTRTARRNHVHRHLRRTRWLSLVIQWLHEQKSLAFQPLVLALAHYGSDHFPEVHE